MHEISAALAAITGEQYVQAQNGVLTVAPASSEEVSAVLRVAHEHRCPVEPFGGGTKKGWGYGVPPKLTLATHRFDQLREHTWQDMTCTVDAGCTWSAMQSGLAQHSQHVALDPLWPERATVGGIIAANDSGALRLRYGGLRDLVIGMTIVLADGTIAKTGGKVVKNVAGYDLHKLMIGALGTLGVVTSVNFRLHSIPHSTRSLSVSAPSAEVLGKLLLKLLHAQLCIIAMQLRGGEQGFELDVRLASLAEVVDAQALALEALAQSERLTTRPSTDEVWNARQHLLETAYVCKCTMLPADIPRFAERVRQAGGDSVTQATGIMYAAFPLKAGDGLSKLRHEVEQARGFLTILKQPAEATLDCWGTPPDTLPLMREIKRRFDPERILNPGRFLGHI
jgi:glycolate oxidase FAD binding subunit